MIQRSALLLSVCALGIVVSGTAGAAVTCSSIAAVDVNTGTSGSNTVSGGSSIACTVGPVTFSNFAYTNAGGDPNPVVDLVSVFAVPNVSWGIVLNPNLMGNSSQDVHLVFEVTSTVPLSMVTLNDGGSPPSGIQEKVCDSSGVSLTGTCVGAQLANIAANDVSPNMTGTFAPQTTIFIWKDIDVGVGGHISAFTQDFLAATTPEPASFALMGAGLIGIALIRRRVRS
jgi:hypothetical protein